MGLYIYIVFGGIHSLPSARPYLYAKKNGGGGSRNNFIEMGDKINPTNLFCLLLEGPLKPLEELEEKRHTPEPSSIFYTFTFSNLGAVHN